MIKPNLVAPARDHGRADLLDDRPLAAMLAGIGTPGEGFPALGYGSMGNIGTPGLRARLPLFRSQNLRDSWIPVARIADIAAPPERNPMRSPARTRTITRIKSSDWRGGNRFHHHQDHLQRLVRACAKRTTSFVNEPCVDKPRQNSPILFPAIRTTTLDATGYRRDITGPFHFWP